MFFNTFFSITCQIQIEYFSTAIFKKLKFQFFFQKDKNNIFKNQIIFFGFFNY
jgi:hypothetical protein